ncbi:hypothetical protein SCHPADRAFT_928563 [Schizopora paradoxa]|uniref:DUF862-domain-containing protein n=1 Tax=Schizopora paradoxa TaxID=27342 RepID=A0A0H2RP44_9AGAM|nr:hypothetical protein SCHPADRAFT_928563 [Schizopora paradoxa]
MVDFAAQDVVRTLDDNVVKPLDAVSRDFVKGVGELKDKAAGLVILGWHPVGGVGGKLFEQIVTPLEMIALASKYKDVPNPTHHWAVLVGDYIHELNADTSLDVVYQNYRYNTGELWYSKEIGTTRFSDEALRIAGEKAIAAMEGSYNLVHNNCQKFALGMIDLIIEGPREKFMTTYSPAAVVAEPKFIMRPVVEVYATKETAKAVMEAAKEKEAAEAEAAGGFPGAIICKYFPTVEEAEAATKARDEERAVKAAEAAEAAAVAAKEAVEEVEDVSVKKVVIVGEIVPDTEHVEKLDFAKQLMEEQTPVLTN